MEDEIVEYPFDFIQDGLALNPKQEKKWKVYTTLLGIKRKLDTFDVETSCANAVEEYQSLKTLKRMWRNLCINNQELKICLC